MTRLYLVRHGRATAGWDVDPDPGLDDLGIQQAAAVALRLDARGPLPVVTSPMRRCRQTAEAFERRWGNAARIEHRVVEIPSPEGVPMVDRVTWLRSAMAGTWAELPQVYREYRDDVLAWASAATTDTVVCSHFVAINALIGAATGDDRLVCVSLDNCSVTIIDVTDGRIELIEPGHAADTLIR